MFGLFAENGPFSVTENLELERRNTAWSLTHNVIYIDNPVGEDNKSLKIVFKKSVPRHGVQLHLWRVCREPDSSRGGPV